MCLLNNGIHFGVLLNYHITTSVMCARGEDEETEREREREKERTMKIKERGVTSGERERGRELLWPVDVDR